MALDQGTSSSRAIIYDATGQVVAVAQSDIDLIFPQDGWVEQDPEQLWQSIVTVGRQAIAESGLAPSDIVAIGITNQRETTLLWDRATGHCVHNALVWQDRRGAARCLTMESETLADGRALSAAITEATGLIVDPYFSSTKVAWLLENVDGAQQAAEDGRLCFGTVDSYLIWRLSNGQRHVTDATNASRTQLFDINRQAWSDELLAYFRIPSVLLPEVLDSAANFAVADAEWFGAPIPITGVAGDQQSALIGQACFAPGMSKSTYGTGCFAMTNTGAERPRSSQRLLSTVAYRIKGETTYALEGSIFVAGVAIKWLRDQLNLIEHAVETKAAFERCHGDAQGVFVVPAFTGLGAPHWQPSVRGLITGLTLDSNRDQIITATLQSVVLQTQELLQAMAQDGAPVETLRIDGGMVVNDALCQCLADILNVNVQRPQDVETTAKGAAILAALGSGELADLQDAASTWQLDQTFTAKMPQARRQQLLDGYARAVAQAMAG
ncbi:MAG: glycerol kinase GlpK [Proteobacteria bacterium]|nr:glycerol kinase GlpK [Pseudomonadota bacterium]